MNLASAKLGTYVLKIFKLLFVFLLLGNASMVKTGEVSEYTVQKFLVIVCGFVIILTSIYGFGAIACESLKNVKRYTVGLITNIVVCIVLIIFVLFHTTKREKLEGHMTKLFDDGHEKERDEFQIFLKCCGLKGPTDYGTEAPSSCCKANVNNATCPVKEAYQRPCTEAALNYYKSSTQIYAICGLGILILEGIICCLTWKIISFMRKRDEESKAKSHSHNQDEYETIKP